MTGRSGANQRLESWWGMMMREGTKHYNQMFGELKDEGMFTGNYLDKAVIQVCFRGSIQVKNVATLLNRFIHLMTATFLPICATSFFFYDA